MASRDADTAEEAEAAHSNIKKPLKRSSARAPDRGCGWNNGIRAESRETSSSSRRAATQPEVCKL